MSRNECNCRHDSLQKLKNKIYICKDCSVLAFNTSRNNTASYNYFIKPKIFNKKAEENPIEIFNAIYDKSILNKNEIHLSEMYRSYRPKLLSYIKKMCISYRLSTKAYYLSIYNYTKKIVDKSIENDSINEKYNSIQIAFSAVYISRRLYGLNIQCRKHFKSIYEVGFSYYSSCVRAISNIDKPEGNNNICNTEQVSHRLKRIKVIEDEPIMIYEPEEKVNHSYAKSMVKPMQWKPLVLPFIENAKKNNLYESIQTEPSRKNMVTPIQ